MKLVFKLFLKIKIERRIRKEFSNFSEAVDFLWMKGELPKKYFKLTDVDNLGEIMLNSKNEEIIEIISEEIDLRSESPWLKKYSFCILNPQSNEKDRVKGELEKSLERKNNYAEAYIELVKFYLENCYSIVGEEEKELKGMIDYCLINMFSCYSSQKCNEFFNFLKMKTRSAYGDDFFDECREKIINDFTKELSKKS